MRKLCPSKDLVIKKDPKRKLGIDQSSREFTYSAITTQGSTTTIILEGSMPTNIGFLGHLSPRAMGAGFLRGLLLGRNNKERITC
jgi:hypothetical protein